MLLIVLALAMTACKGTKGASSANNENNTLSMEDKNDEENQLRVRSASEATANNDSRSLTTDSTDTRTNIAGSDGSVSPINTPTGDVENPTISSTISDTDLKKMYINLQMTESQIQTFEKAIQDFNESVKYHPNGEMLGTVGNEQERRLKEILSENQWDKYQVWRNNRDK